jgi:hypothetical protein
LVFGARRRAIMGHSREEMDMASHDRTSHEQTHEHRRAADGQELIDEVGREGTVPTTGGETSVGTTPIGLGSVEPVGGHREASDRIMGEREGDEANAERPRSKLE